MVVFTAVAAFITSTTDLRLEIGSDLKTYNGGSTNATLGQIVRIKTSYGLKNGHFRAAFCRQVSKSVVDVIKVVLCYAARLTRYAAGNGVTLRACLRR